jgi:aminoglycoside phosphotransferase (APT) family kinase protein
LLNLPGQDIAREFHLVSWVYRQGIRVAEPLWLEDGRPPSGLRYFVSRQASGCNLGNALTTVPLNDAQIQALARELAAIHKLQPEPTDPAIQRSGIGGHCFTQPLSQALRFHLEKVRMSHFRSMNVGPYPSVETVFKWLINNIPPDDDKPVLVHGDYGLHNILFDGDDMTAVLDWEAFYPGDRAHDISWLLSSIGQHVSTDRFMRVYERAGGRNVSRYRLKYYDVLQQMLMVIVAIDAQRQFEKLRYAGPQYCVLGLGFMHQPASSLERLIREAEAAKA